MGSTEATGSEERMASQARRARFQTPLEEGEGEGAWEAQAATAAAEEKAATFGCSLRTAVCSCTWTCAATAAERGEAGMEGSEGWEEPAEKPV